MSQHGKMNIEKALEHFEWKFKNHWKPTKKDLEAYNAILDYKEIQETKNLSENENLAKLWIHQLMLLNKTKMYSSERAIQAIDEILNTSVYSWCKELHRQIGFMQWNVMLGDEYSKALEEGNITKMQNISTKLIDEKEKEIWNLLTKEVKEENIIKFVSGQITRIINKFEK